MSTTTIYIPSSPAQAPIKSAYAKRIKTTIFRHNPFRKPAHYFIANNVMNDGHGRDADNPMSINDFLDNHAKRIRAIDSVYFKRDEIFENDDVLTLLKAKGTWVLAFGQGDSPIIKTKESYLEVDDCSWF